MVNQTLNLNIFLASLPAFRFPEHLFKFIVILIHIWLFFLWFFDHFKHYLVGYIYPVLGFFFNKYKLTIISFQLIFIFSILTLFYKAANEQLWCIFMFKNFNKLVKNKRKKIKYLSFYQLYWKQNWFLDNNKNCLFGNLFTFNLKMYWPKLSFSL